MLVFLFVLVCVYALVAARQRTRDAIECMRDALERVPIAGMPRTPPSAHAQTLEWAMRNRHRGWSGQLLRVAMLSAGLSLLTACAMGKADARVRTALDVFAEVIDPAYSVAMDSCVAPQEVAVAQAEAGLATAAQADAVIAQVRARCDQVREGFEAIRLHHEEARRFVDSGELERAERVLEQIRSDWQKLPRGAT